MYFANYDSISFPSNKNNEDIVFASSFYGWVIDGATGLAKKNITGCTSDAAWFVKAWDEYLKKNIDNMSLTLKQIINNGMEFVEREFYKLDKTNSIDKLSIPSASIALIRINNNKIEYFLLGDCTLIAENVDGKHIKIKDKSVEKLDGIAIEELKGYMKEDGLNFNEARNRVSDLLIKHRLLKNTPKGYWVLEFNREAIDNAIVGELEFEQYKKVLLMSDGFAAIADVYKHIEHSSIIGAVEKLGLNRVYEIIREIENEDIDMKKYPRLKVGDDASAIIFC
ncbi:protein phosphatase 2C domain-containing protein [Clostridium sp. OS1-26]|uniref:protein phosphatase 2C domain-containing protein n=1 Tax=Clostridium sp. OS1-26 TaxID=3070681 RepID=UPI0027E1DE21|nr:protein phosphatase 2C domain-containing protein [Clostridium sp. OS1-26]WML36697.1 protein phosphatase 2C domain-containing protein [Clostridium sp. OS1-26]